MKTLELTNHAQKRTQQRGISELMVQLIAVFGEDHYQTGGYDHCYIPKRRVRELRKAIDRLDKQSLMIAPNGAIVTAQHDYRKIREK